MISRAGVFVSVMWHYHEVAFCRSLLSCCMGIEGYGYDSFDIWVWVEIVELGIDLEFLFDTFKSANALLILFLLKSPLLLRIITFPSIVPSVEQFKFPVWLRRMAFPRWKKGIEMGLGGEWQPRAVVSQWAMEWLVCQFEERFWGLQKQKCAQGLKLPGLVLDI